MRTPDHQLSPKGNKRTARYIAYSILAIVLFSLPFFCNRPPIDGFFSLKPPINDSCPIGKYFNNGSLSGESTCNFKVYRSWDSIRKISGYNNIVHLKETISKEIVAKLKLRNEVVISVDSLVIYQLEDFSSLPLQGDGDVVVTSAIVAKKFRISSDATLGVEGAAKIAKDIAKDAEINVEGKDVSVMTGTGLVSYVKVIQVKKNEPKRQAVKWINNRAELADINVGEQCSINVGSADSADICYPDWSRRIACAKITFQSGSLGHKSGSILFSPSESQIDIGSRFRENDNFLSYTQIPQFACSLPTLILKGQNSTSIYKYLIAVDNALITHGTYTPIGKHAGSTINFWGIYDIINSSGSMTVTMDSWNYHYKSPSIFQF
jgi:hypothetical protein